MRVPFFELMNWYYYYYLNLHRCYIYSLIYYLASLFARLSNHYCKPPRLVGAFDSKYEAEVACEQMQSEYGNCSTINDADCDDDVYQICNSTAEIKFSNRGTCIYHKGARNQAFDSLNYYLKIIKMLLNQN